MSPREMPFLCAGLVLIITVWYTSGQILGVNGEADAKQINQREKRQLFYGGYMPTYNDTLNGGNVFYGSASFSMEGAGSYEDALEFGLLQALLNRTTTTTTTTTTTPAPTTPAGRDLSLACTCIGGRCVSFKDIYDLCLSTVKNADTCLANLDLLCENVKTQAVG